MRLDGAGERAEDVLEVLVLVFGVVGVVSVCGVRCGWFQWWDKILHMYVYMCKEDRTGRARTP